MLRASLFPGGVIPGLVGLALALSPPAMAGSKGDSVYALLSAEKGDKAREKCNRWDAVNAADDPDLREACAKAFWVLTETDGSLAAWAVYGERWKGTSWSELAREREAAVALDRAPPTASERALLDLADKYAGTRSVQGLQQRASDAAVRDAATPEAAVAVANRYPDHPDLPRLVERFPEGFLVIEVTGRIVNVRTQPSITLPSELAPRVRWVAQQGKGVAGTWDETARRLLEATGVAPSVLQNIESQTPEAGPRYPLCFVSGQIPGFGPAVEVTVGSGVVVKAVPWDVGCGADAWPVFYTVEGEAVTSLSLRPGHVVKLGVANDALSALFGVPAGEVKLEDGVLYQRAGSTWRATPVTGGQAWVTGRPPGSAAQTLSARLRGSVLPEGWTLAPTPATADQPAQIQLKADRLNTLPPAYQTWVVPAGDVRSLSPLAQAVLGLTPAAVGQGGAAALGPAAGWKRAQGGGVLREPPTGASIAGIYQIDTGAVDVALSVVAGLGPGRDRIEPLDGWKADLDDDKVGEIIIRARLDGEGALIIVDPIDGTDATTATGARVFVFPGARVLADNRVAEVPFTFRKGDHVYMAWAGRVVTGPTTRLAFLGLVRDDGAGFVTHSFDLPDAP